MWPYLFSELHGVASESPAALHLEAPHSNFYTGIAAPPLPLRCLTCGQAQYGCYFGSLMSEFVFHGLVGIALALYRLSSHGTVRRERLNSSSLLVPITRRLLGIPCLICAMLTISDLVALPNQPASRSDISDSPPLASDSKNSSATKEPLSSSSKSPSPSIIERTLGCYTFVIEVPSRTKYTYYFPTSFLQLAGHFRDFFRDWHHVLRFARDCYAVVGTRLFILFVLLNTLLSMSSAVMLYLNGNLMSSLERVIFDENTDRYTLYRNIASLLIWKFFRRYLTLLQESRVELVVRQRITAHFDDNLIRARLRLDVPTYNLPETKARFDQFNPYYASREMFDIFDGSLRTLTRSGSILAELVVVFQFLRGEKNGWIMAGMAAIQPLLDLSGGEESLFYLTNKAMVRLDAIRWLTHESYHKHTITNGLRSYADQELKKCRAELEGVNMDDAWSLVSLESSTSSGILSYLSTISNELPLVTYALYTLHNKPPGGALPFKMLGVLSSSASSLSNGVDSLLRDVGDLAGFHTKLRDLYQVAEIENLLVEGVRTYPLEGDSKEGMKIEFRSVSFSYPRQTALALRDMSFVVHPGQLCVLVGENGCGKSSTVSLMNRLFDPKSGEILVDDVPIQEFRSDTLRRSQVMLHQDYATFPTTISDNIAYGSISPFPSSANIQRAAEASGAHSWISKLPKGYDSTLSGEMASNSEFKPDSVLPKEMEGRLQPSVDASGGEWQRMAIARSFMRTLTDEEGGDDGGDGEGRAKSNVKLLCYDEPSSALDPKAEFALFEKLRNERGGKTLIFITHRFGHLTKYADIILYIKDGHVEEQGTHDELLKLDGHYAQLYNVQAQAFS